MSIAPLAPSARPRTSTPILAIDVATPEAALQLVRTVAAAEWVKVGLQLFTAAGPALVRELVHDRRRVFLDLKFHDIPTTVGNAVRSAAAIGVELLTVHGSGGMRMLRAAREAAGPTGAGGPRLFAVTLLTSLSEPEAAQAWGRPSLSAGEEVARLARLARDAHMDGVVASVHEASSIRAAAGAGLALLTPGIRLAGDDPRDQARVASPEEAARAGVDFLVVGRTVAAAADPAAAWQRVLDGILRGGEGVQATP
jgi:orotidine-5'-phosphate decarboxylase